MTQEERDMIKNQVRNEISALEKSIITLSEMIDEEVELDDSEWFTSQDSNPSKEINEIALDKARQRLVILKNVLMRVDSPEYGICIKCGNPIPIERLKAMPSATRCLSCR
jgi:DnaK suppressor protein